MAEIALGVLGLVPPFIQFTVEVGNRIKEILDTKNFADDPSSLSRIRDEMESWTTSLEMLSGLEEQNGNKKDKLIRSCKHHLRKYMSMLKMIKKKLKEYHETGEMFLIVEVRDLLRDLEKQQHEEEVKKWLIAVNTKITIMQHKSLSNIEAAHPLVMGMLSKILAQLETLSPTPSLQPPQLQDRMDQFIGSLPDLGDSLLGEYWSSDETDNSDSESTSLDGNEELDTADTSLQDVVSTGSTEIQCGPISPEKVYVDQDTMTDVAYSERGTMPCTVGMDPPSRSPSYMALCDRNLIANLATRDYENTRPHGFPQVVAGSWDQTSSAGFEIMEISEEDWQNNQHFESSDSESLMIRVALPEKCLMQLIATYGEDLESLPETKSTTRRFSAILRPLTSISPWQPGPSASFCHASDLRYHETQLFVHWDMEYMSTKGAVYFRLGKLKELFENIETKRLRDSTCPLPSSDGIAVCITIPWLNYSRWAQGQKIDGALDTLWEQGIVATLPVLVKLENDTVEPHVWCEAKTKSSGTRERDVHAIIQEYVHPGLPPETGDSSETRFIVVIYRTGDRSEWVEAVQSILCQNSRQMLKPYRLTPNGMHIDVDDLIRHCQKGTMIDP